MKQEFDYKANIYFRTDLTVIAENQKEEEELDAIIMEEFDELGYAVDEEHSNLNVEEDENEEGEFEE